ncbi:hypothetical protein J6590_025300 [Homalodisca vitripennis]|nr:hypothetical protein J6590_025300 [Homalodisca vitripennis]
MVSQVTVKVIGASRTFNYRSDKEGRSGRIEETNPLTALFQTAANWSHLSHADLEETSIEIYGPETMFKVEADSGSESVQGTESPCQMEYVGIPPPPPATSFYSPELPSGAELPGGSDNPAAEEDDVDSFMRSIALTVKKFPPRVRAEAKFKILAAVTELEFPGRWQDPADSTKSDSQ